MPGRLGTLALAAEELGVSLGAVSQQILKTEQQLGRALFTRTPKGLVPTPFGAEVLAYLERGFRELTRGVALAQEPNAICSPFRWPRSLRPSGWCGGCRISSRRIPTCRSGSMPRSTLVDLDHSDVDLAIRVGPGNWPNVKAELLLEQRVFPVCAPALAARLKTPRDLAKRADHP